MGTAKMLSAEGLTNNHFLFSVCAKEQRLLEELRKVQYGMVEVIMANGLPERIEKVKESIKL